LIQEKVICTDRNRNTFSAYFLFWRWTCRVVFYVFHCSSRNSHRFFACVYRAIKRSDCFHADGDSAPCHVSNIIYMVFFGIVQVILSQIPDFDRIWWLSIVAAIMSFSYSTIGLGLGLGKASGMETHPSPQLHIYIYIWIHLCPMFLLWCGLSAVFECLHWDAVVSAYLFTCRNREFKTFDYWHAFRTYGCRTLTQFTLQKEIILMALWLG
jgi:hypothetical protein